MVSPPLQLPKEAFTSRGNAERSSLLLAIQMMAELAASFPKRLALQVSHRIMLNLPYIVKFDHHLKSDPQSRGAGVDGVIAGEGAVIAQEDVEGGSHRQADAEPDDRGIAVGAGAADGEGSAGRADEARRDEAAGIGEVMAPADPQVQPQGLGQPDGKIPVSSRPRRLRAEAVVWLSTCRSMAPAPLSVKAPWPMTMPCMAAKGVRAVRSSRWR